MTITNDELEGYRADPLPEDATIHQRMVRILGELPAIGKVQRNEQQKFMYRGHDDVLNALNPLLAEHGVYVVPMVLERVTAERTTQRGSTMYEVNLKVMFTFYGLAGDSVTASTWGEGTDSGDKSTNKAMTMAFKNVLAQAFAVSTAELSDADAGTPEDTTRSAQTRTQGSGDARAERSQAPREFDPGRDLLPTAIVVKSVDDATAIRLGQRDLDPDQDWMEVEGDCAQHVWSKTLEDLTPRETGEFWKRLANAVVKVNELAGPGDFPPPSHDQIREGYAWAFNNAVITLSAPVTPPEDEAGTAGTPEGEAA